MFRQTETPYPFSLGVEVDMGAKERLHRPVLKDGAWWQYVRSCGVWDVWRQWGKREPPEEAEERAFRVLDWFNERDRNGQLRSARRLHRELVRSGEAEKRFVLDGKGKLWLHLSTVAEGKPFIVCRPHVLSINYHGGFVYSVLSDGEKFVVVAGLPRPNAVFGPRALTCPPLPPELDPGVLSDWDTRALWWELLALHRKWLQRHGKRGE